MKTITLTFPNKTAKQLVEECDNKLGDGKLLFNISWYKNEYFYTTEKCREGTYKIILERIGINNSWNKCHDLIEKEGGEMLNFAEAIYVAIEYYKQTKKYPWDEYTWLSSILSDGDVLIFGNFDSRGASLDWDRPDNDWRRIGSVFSRRIDELMKDHELYEAIQTVKKAGYKVIKEY